jgi:hypothetical protein
MLFDIEKQVRISINDFKNANPNVAFPVNLTDAVLAKFGMANLFYPPQPAATAIQKVSDGGQTKVNGIWTVTWIMVYKTPVELAAVNQQFKTYISIQVQKRLDRFAQTRGYDNIASAASYANGILSATPTAIELRIHSEGTYASTIRLTTWIALEVYDAQVIAGTLPAPTSIADIIPYLPALAWPV